ncbi:MAG: hypothetical protein K9K64_01680 [Desulfohalobiaceae bacterium]|nr:hypothetical protein [Desulfohalobiaceae bacterium]
MWPEGALRFSGFARIYGANDLHGDRGNEDERAFRNRIRAELRYSLPEDEPVLVPGLKAGRTYLVLSGDADYLWFGPKESRDDYDLEIYEAYLNWGQGPLQLRLGKQLVRWGKTDEISPLDAVNAQDLRLFTFPDREERKLPNWMFRARLFLEAVTLEGVYIPFFREDKLDFFGTDWAVFRHVKEDVRDSPVNPAFRDFFADIGVDEDEPADTLENGSLGARVATTLGRVDIGASYLYGYDPRPHFVEFPVQNISVSGAIDAENLEEQAAQAVVTGEVVRAKYLRSQMIGLDFETTAGDFGLRGESAYFDARTFLTDNLTSVDRQSLFSVLGLDYLGKKDWYANVQVLHQHVFDHQEDILYFEQDNWGLSWELSREFFRGRAEAGLEGLYFLSDGSYAFNPRLLVQIKPALEVEIGLDVFEGNPDTLMGQYDNNDQAYLRLEYYF